MDSGSSTPRVVVNSVSVVSTSPRLVVEPGSLSSRLNLRVSSEDLVSLIHAGFIELVASKTLAEGYHGASKPLASRAPARSQETETETYRPTHPPELLQTVEPERWVGGDDLKRLDPLAELPAIGGAA